MRAAALALLALAACSKGSEEPVNGAAPATAETERAVTVPDQPVAWSYAGTAEAPEARFGPSAAAPILALACDRDDQVLRLRHAPVPGADPAARLVLAVGGEERLLETRAAGGALEAELLLADPLIATMAAPAARILVAIGSNPAVEVPGGAAIRRTVEACRRPVEQPIEGAAFTALLPCADCAGIETSIVFAGEPGSGRYRMTKRYRGTDDPVAVEDGTSVLERDAEGPVVRLDPARGGATTWLDWPEPGVLVMRDSRGDPDPLLDRYPLRRRR